MTRKRRARPTEGVRGKRMLAEIDKKESVSRLRHPTAEEYKDVFGEHSQSTVRGSNAQKPPNTVAANVSDQRDVAVSSEVVVAALPDASGQREVTVSREVDVAALTDASGQREVTVSCEVDVAPLPDASSQREVAVSREVDVAALTDASGQREVTVSCEVDVAALTDASGQREVTVSCEVDVAALPDASGQREVAVSCEVDVAALPDASGQREVTVSCEVDVAPLPDASGQREVAVSREVDVAALTDASGQREVTVSCEVDVAALTDASGQREVTVSCEVDVAALTDASGQREVTVSCEVDVAALPDASGQREVTVSREVDVAALTDASGQREVTVSCEVDVAALPDASGQREVAVSRKVDVAALPNASGQREVAVSREVDVAALPDASGQRDVAVSSEDASAEIKILNEVRLHKPRVIVEEIQLKNDGNSTRHIVKSWSLSDLTQDKDYLEFQFIRKTKSECLLSDDSNVLNSLPLRPAQGDISSDEEYHPPFADDSTDSEIESVIEFGDLQEGRKRRHVSDPNSWKRNQAKIRRMRGEEYLGYSKSADGKIQQNALKAPREMGETCKSDFCKKSKLRGCERFTENCRKSIHNYFWKNLNWDQRKVYVSSMVSRSDTTRKISSDSRREGTFYYFLPITKNGSEKVQVCREMFLSTLSLRPFTVQSWVKNSEYGMSPNQVIQNSLRPKPEKPNNDRKMLTLANFLNWLPKMPSHYARKDTTKLFLEPVYHSLVELFNAYKTYCRENEEPQVSRFTFEKEFHNKNLALYTLKKDMCDICSTFKAGNLDEADHQVHLVKKNRARKEKEDDKKKADAGEIILLTMDLQAVKLSPYLTASALYFKTKLTCHNFTMYNLTTHHCTCYWFDETAADLTASTFATFVIDYLERHCVQHARPIVIYSDGCTYQNRNAILANALLQFSKVKNITITQKYLEPGHTQMECDSVHSAIERKFKNREIHLPSDYIKITREARRSQPYETVEVDYKFIKDYTLPQNSLYKSIRPGRKAGDPQVVDIRAMKYNTMTIEYKLDFDADWMPLPQRPKVTNSTVEYPQLHSSRIPISATKYNHLQQLKSVINKDCHGFYDALPYN